MYTMYRFQRENEDEATVGVKLTRKTKRRKVEKVWLGLAHSLLSYILCIFPLLEEHFINMTWFTRYSWPVAAARNCFPAQGSYMVRRNNVLMPQPHALVQCMKHLYDSITLRQLMPRCKYSLHVDRCMWLRY